MLGNLNGMLSQVQNLQAALKAVVVEATVGDGAVTVAMNGAQDLLRVQISPELLAGNITRLEDLVTEALNKVQVDTRNKLQEQVTKMTGINLNDLANMFQG